MTGKVDDDVRALSRSEPAPSGRRSVAAQDWRDALLDLSTRLPIESGERRVVEAVVDALHELLRRNLRESPAMENAANVIISEAERMAEIVRKIGKITRYETKSYVGEARILDLEKASEDPEGVRR